MSAPSVSGTPNFSRGAELEAAFIEALQETVAPPALLSAHDLPDYLRAVTAEDGTGLSRYFERGGTIDEFAELVIHRSAYQLKEADPHTWAIPRLTGRPRARQ